MENELAVIDASLVIKAILPNPELARCQAVLAHLRGRRLVAPALWIYEVTSALSKAVYFEQLTTPEAEDALKQAFALGVQVILPDETQAHLALRHTLRLRRVAAYDSFYLATAEALNATFWTADRRLIQAFQGKHPAWMHYADDID